MKPLVTIVERNSDHGSCSYCKRGKLKKDGLGLEFPYTNMVRVEGSNVSTCFCPDCFEELLNVGNRFDFKSVDPTEQPSE